MRPGLLRYLAAMAYDLMIVVALLFVLAALALLVRAGAPVEPRSFSFRLLLLAGWWAYFAWSWTHGGQTVGMRAWRLHLKSANGEPVGLGQASVRFVGAWLSAVLAGVGFLWRLVDSDRLTWHDRLSGTRLALGPKLAKAQHREQRHEE